MVNEKRSILVLADYYLPGYKAGGPIRTLVNMVDRIGDEFQFKIVTADRDFKDYAAYPGVTIDHWNRVGKADVFYMSPKRQSLKEFKKILCSTECDVVYLNSFFSPHFTIKPLLLRWLRLIPDKSLILAPRGEFSSGALALKSFKKYIYISAAKVLGLYRDVLWQASSEYEEKDICYWFGDCAKIVIAPNIPSSITGLTPTLSNHKKIAGKLKIVFLSRITRKKNLCSALRMLVNLKGEVQFNIYGPLEDLNYWAECNRIINLLPNNIRVQYMGAINHDQVSTVIRKYDLFFLPTLGENFGHVILEALADGCPVLISDQTPWRDLEKEGVGWDLPLNCMERFQEVLQKCIDMNEQEYNILSKRAYKFGLKIVEDKTALDLNRKLFYKAFYSLN